MIGGLIDRWDAWAERYKRPISIISLILFVLTCATYIGIIRLPEIEFLSTWQAVIASSVLNACWWGVLRPRIERHRQQRSKAKDEGGSTGL